MDYIDNNKFFFFIVFLASCGNNTDIDNQVFHEKDRKQICINNISKSLHDAVTKGIYYDLIKKVPMDDDFIGFLELESVVNGLRVSTQKVFNNIPIPDYDSNSLTKYLDLSYNEILYIPNKIVTLSDLEYLSLSNNRLKAMNPFMMRLSKLKKIDLSSNGLENIPIGVSSLEQLESLVLADNKISNLPDFISMLTNLRELDISNLHPSSAIYNNKIEDFPEVIFSLDSLEKLFLEHLLLEDIGDGIKKMKNLKVISVAGCNFLDIDNFFKVISEMPDLVAIDISFMGLSKLPKSFKGLKNLKLIKWFEEGSINKEFIESQLQSNLENTNIFYGAPGTITPFLRGNSIKVLNSQALK